MDLTPLLAPRSIAVLGATDRPDAYGDTILRNLERIGFEGPLWGINPGREAVRDVPCVPSIADLPEPVDALAVAIPAAGVPAAIEAAARRGCGGAVVVSAGFGEVADGRGLEDELRRAALAAGGTRGDGDAPFPICGPNGNGVVSVHERSAIWGDSLRPQLRDAGGGVALVSQSGNVAVNALGSRRGTGFHTVVSTGNGAVCDAGDWLLAISEREGVRSIALFLESDGDGPKLAEAFARCCERDVRVAVLKVGTSGAGAAAAAAHTGALAGDQRVFRSLVEEAGASWARNPHELLELARALAEPRARPRAHGLATAPVRSGLAILTCSGGDSGNAADEAERLGVELPPLAEPTRERLAELLPGAATAGNPLDYTSLIWAETERLRAIVETVASDPAIDQLLLFHDTPTDLSAEAAEGWEATRAGLIAGATAGEGDRDRDRDLDMWPAAPLFASTLPDLISEEIIRELSAAGIASVGGLSTAVLCARELRRRAGEPGRMRAIAAASTSDARTRTGGGGGGGGGEPGGWLSEAAAKDLLRDAGVPVPRGHTVTDAPGAVAAASEMGGAVALKLSSAAIQHKSELGAIELGLTSPAEIEAAAARLLALPVASEATDAELLVEEMAPPGVELIVAAHRDGVVPALVVGLGGIWAEALGDVAVVPLPAPPERVESALRSLRGASLISGARGGEAIDLAAVAATASDVGSALLDAGLSVVELNPLIAGPNGCVAADALVRR
ncbi:MAG: acetate--CoA ligase family protein [Solirubrobacterales bacterium]